MRRFYRGCAINQSSGAAIVQKRLLNFRAFKKSHVISGLAFLGKVLESYGLPAGPGLGTRCDSDL